MMPKRLIFAVLLSQTLFAHASESDDVLERARVMIEQGEQMREAAEERFRVAEADCYNTFFVNRCLDRARQTRMTDIQAARELEHGGKRMELAERMRLATERKSPIDMRAGRLAPQPSAATAAEREAREAELAKLPAAEREAIYARELAERLERRVREIQEQGAAATRAIIQPIPPAPPAEPAPQPLSEEEATRIREERERAAREAAALERKRREQAPPPAVEEPVAPAAVSDDEAARIRAERETRALEAEARAAEERASRDAERARLRGEEVPASEPATEPEPVPEPAPEPVLAPEPIPVPEPAAAPAPEPEPTPEPVPEPEPKLEPEPEPKPEPAPEVPVVLDPPATISGSYELLPETRHPPILPGAPAERGARAEVIPLTDLADIPAEELQPLEPLK